MSDHRGPGMEHVHKRKSESTKDKPNKRCQKQDPRIAKLNDNFAASTASISNEFQDVLKIKRNLVSNHFALIAVSEWRYIARCISAAVKIMRYEEDKCLETINPLDWNIVDCEDTDLVVFRNPFGTQSYDDQKSKTMNVVLDKIKQYFAVEQEGNWTNVIIVTHKGCLEEYKKRFDHDLLQEPLFLHTGPEDVHCTTSETSDPVHRNLLEQSRCYIEQYRKQFTRQSIYVEAGNHLQQRRLVVISGGRFSGRNDLAMCLIPSHELSRVFILTEADELKHVHFKDTFAVVILDLGGKPHLDQSEAFKWYRKFDMLYAATRQGKINVIITFDKDVLETWLETLPRHKMLDHVINIGDDVQYDTRTTEGLELPTESEAVVKLEMLTDEDYTAESSGVTEQPSSPETTFRSHLVATLQGTYDIQLSTDRNVCDIWDICILLNGSFLLTDFSNRIVKKMDQAFNVTESLATPGQPVGVCQVDKNTAAVALWDRKRIQLISLKEKMSLTASLDVGDNCSGVACSEDLLYVSCGGKGKLGSKKGQGHLEVFCFDGTPISSYYQGFSCPEYVYFNKATSYAYITDATNGLIIEKDGKFQTRKYILLESPAGVCNLNSNQVCIAGYSSDNVVVVNNVLEEDSEYYELLPSVEEPAGLCYDGANSRLIVTMAKSNVIKVYDLTT